MSEDAKNLHGLSSPDPLPDPEQHPDPDRLYAYQADELTPEEDLEIQEHLALCGHCTELLLDVQHFTALPAQEETGFSEFERAAGWRQLRARLDQDGFFTRGRRRWWRSRVATVAAVFVLAVLGLSIYSLTRPAAEAWPFQTIDPLYSTRGEESKIDEVKLPVRLLLHSPAETRYSEYRAEIRDLKGTLIKDFSGLRQNDRYEVELPLDRDALRLGEYRLRLRGLQKGQLKKVADYGFRVPK